MHPRFELRDRVTAGPVSLLGPPYEEFKPWRTGSELRSEDGGGGWVAVWELGHRDWEIAYEVVRDRPGGLPLVLVLPEGSQIESVARLLRVIEACRPSTVLPFHETPKAREVASLVCRPPTSFPTEITDYLAWRGLSLDPGTSRIVRRIVELSDVVQTITALSRGLYMSRRALGRRFLSRGLPVPSHWLHVIRVLKAAVKLQNTDASLFSVACSLGYPDGFSLSNQMHRLCGIRPTQARERIGWEWILEAWLVKESEEGGLTTRGMQSRESVFWPQEEQPTRLVAEDSRAVGMVQ